MGAAFTTTQGGRVDLDCSDDRLKTINELVADRRGSERREVFRAEVASLPSLPLDALIRRVATACDPLMLWALHLVLDARGVPPCLRGPHRQDTQQIAFVSWLADLLWFVRRHPTHRPTYKRWRGLFENVCGSDRWHRVARWVYRSGRGSGHYYGKGLGLSDADRQPLVTMISNSMRGDRIMLARLPEIRERLHAHAVSHRDRSGAHSPGEVTSRRTELLRVFLLAGRSPTLAADYRAVLSGDRVSRQALTRQIQAIEEVTNLRLLRS